jgi:hypothetical protein
VAAAVAGAAVAAAVVVRVAVDADPETGAPRMTTRPRSVRGIAALLLALAAQAACAAIPGPPPADAGAFVDFPLARVGAVNHPLLEELSGLVAASPGAGGFWAHNDSGAEARLFALDAEFRPRVPPWLAHRYGAGDTLLRAPWPGIEIVDASLVDWESIARIGEVLYVGDVGNNGNARRDLGFWELAEPAPAATESIRPRRFLPVHYPEQQAFPGAIWEWDCEAVFSDAGNIYLITKHRAPGEIARFEAGARLYRFDPTTASTSASTPLELIARQNDIELATGADLSPDGEVLAVLSYAALWLFPRPAAGDDWFAGTPVIRTLPIARTRQAEAVTWRDDGHLLIANEAGTVFEMTIDRDRLQTLFSAAR